LQHHKNANSLTTNCSKHSKRDRNELPGVLAIFGHSLFSLYRLLEISESTFEKKKSKNFGQKFTVFSFGHSSIQNREKVSKNFEKSKSWKFKKFSKISQNHFPTSGTAQNVCSLHVPSSA